VKKAYTSSMTKTDQEGFLQLNKHVKRYDRKTCRDRYNFFLSPKRNTTLGPVAGPLLVILSDPLPPFLPSPRYYSLRSNSSLTATGQANQKPRLRGSQSERAI